MATYQYKNTSNNDIKLFVNNENITIYPNKIYESQTALNIAGLTLLSTIEIPSYITQNTIDENTYYNARQIHAFLSDLDSSNVTVSGSTLQRTLKDRFNDNINVRDFGVKGDGTDESALIQYAISSLTNLGLPAIFPPTTRGYMCWNVTVPSNAKIIGSNATTFITPSGCDAGSNRDNSCLNVDGNNVTIDGIHFKSTTVNDAPVFITGLSVSNLTIKNCSFIGNKYECIVDRACTKTLIDNCLIYTGSSGVDYGIGISFIGNSRYFTVKNCLISGYFVTSNIQGSGIQPAGDKWGSVGINCQIGTNFNTLGWKHISGSYIIQDLIPPDHTITDSRIIDPANWEGSTVINLNNSTGIGQNQSAINTTFTSGAFTLSNLPGYSISLSADYLCLSYENSPRYGTFIGNKITGFIYGGISIITGRDINSIGNTFEHIGDIAWDIEGVQRCSCLNSNFYDCGTGAIGFGTGSNIIGCEFKNCGRVIGSWNNTIAYQGETRTTVVGLRGNNSLIGNTFYENTLGAADKTFIQVASPFCTIHNNSMHGRGVYDMHIENAAYPSIVGNFCQGRIKLLNCNGAIINGNTISAATQESFNLENISNFTVLNNTVSFTSSMFGDGTGIKYSGCTNGDITNNRFINLAATAIVDGGSNTSVAVSGNIVY